MSAQRTCLGLTFPLPLCSSLSFFVLREARNKPQWFVRQQYKSFVQHGHASDAVDVQGREQEYSRPRVVDLEGKLEKWCRCTQQVHSSVSAVSLTLSYFAPK